MPVRIEHSEIKLNALPESVFTGVRSRAHPLEKIEASL